MQMSQNHKALWLLAQTATTELQTTVSSCCTEVHQFKYQGAKGALAHV